MGEFLPTVNLLSLLAADPLWPARAYWLLMSSLTSVHSSRSGLSRPKTKEHIGHTGMQICRYAVTEPVGLRSSTSPSATYSERGRASWKKILNRGCEAMDINLRPDDNGTAFQMTCVVGSLSVIKGMVTLVYMPTAKPLFPDQCSTTSVRSLRRCNSVGAVTNSRPSSLRPEYFAERSTSTTACQMG